MLPAPASSNSTHSFLPIPQFYLRFDYKQEAMAASSVPDYMLNPDAVMKDVNAAWRFKTPPDYSKTRAVYKEGASYPIPPMYGIG